MSVCLFLGTKQILFATSAFTLAWAHSVEGTRWEEDWRVSPAGLEIVEARVAGSGAGMEPPEGAVFDGRVWRYRPNLPPQAQVALARSGATGGGWQICVEGQCREIAEPAAEARGPAILKPCP